jgi:hypothetical protein
MLPAFASGSYFQVAVVQDPQSQQMQDVFSSSLKPNLPVLFFLI